MKYKEAVDFYIEHCDRQRRLSIHTIRSYSTVLRKFGEYVEGEFIVDELEGVSRDIVRKYLGYLNDNFAPGTARHHFTVVRGFFSYMEEIEYINESPYNKVHARIKEPKKLPKTLSLEDVNKILVAAYSSDPGVWNGSDGMEEMIHYRDCLVLEFLFNTGLRVQELCNLQFKDFDISTGTIYVFGKGSKERKCYITEQAIFDVYKKYTELRNICMKRIGKKHRFIFVNRFGRQMSAQTARLMIEKYVKIADIKKKVTPHVFRHTFASLLLEEGVDLKHIQCYLGHSTIATTQIYLHISDENAKEVLKNKHPRATLGPEGFGSV